MSHKMSGRALLWEEIPGASVQIVTSLIQACPCAWCDQLGHIAQDCMAHFADDSKRARFPKRKR